MDDTAIREIGDTAVQAARQRLIDVSNTARALITREGEEVTSLEQFAPKRYRFRGLLSTSVLGDFCAFVLRRVALIGSVVPEVGPAKPAGFIDQERLSATVFFNLDDGGHADDRAVLALKPTADYLGLQGATAGRALDQRTLIEWLEDWNRNVVCRMGENGMNLAEAIRAVRAVKISETRVSETRVETAGASRSSLEEIDARGAGGLPDTIDFTCVPYVGLPSRTFSVRVAPQTNHEKPAFMLRIIQREVQQEAIAADFKALLDTGIGAQVNLTIGTFTP